MNRKAFIALILSAALLFLAGCNSEAFNGIYDDDGRIASKSDSSASLMYAGSTWGDTHTITATMSGMKTVWNYTVTEDTQVDVIYTLDLLDGGNVKLVWVTPDGDVITLDERTEPTGEPVEEERLITLELNEGGHRIKIVGKESPKFKLVLTVPLGDLGADD